MKKLFALLLAVAMVLSLAACGGSSTPAATEAPATEAPATEAPVETEATEPAVEVVLPPELTGDYDEDSAALYEYVLGDFKAAYDAALAEDDASTAWAMMAAAEAKLLEAGVMMPVYTAGGNYAMSRVAPGTVTPIMYGNDQDRYQNCLIATEFITAADRAEMKQNYNELKGTGTYMDWAKSFLADKGYELQDNYGLGYSSDPQTWDYFNTSRAADSEAIVNTLEMLLEYDVEGVQQPALATGYTVSDDGLTYTFTIREGAVWVDSQGREVAPVTADDFVAGFQHMLDAQGGLEFLVDGKIVGAHEYIAGETYDFETVGVKALDDYTLEYTLEAPCRYFVTMLGYNPFAPMNRSFYESKGGKFGEEYDPSDAAYTYGTSAENIAYCGPYLVTNHTDSSTIVFQANPSYWNADGINVKTITWLFNDGTDPTKAYNDAKSGILAGAGLTGTNVETAKAEGLFDEYAYVSATNATSYMAFWNINRAQYTNINDENACVSPKTEEQKAATYTAMQNQNFRLALSSAWDRAAYRATRVGEELKLNALRNSYTPGTFVTLTEDVTIDINGTATTFAAGTPYGAVMQAQIDADGYHMTVFDPNADDGTGSSDGFDGWYNPEAAKAYLAAAIEELAAQGVEVSAENPISIDLPTWTGNETFANMAEVVKQSLESVLEGCVVVNKTECVDSTAWYYAGYYTDYGFEANYECYDLSGWGPDYGDPTTYLDTFLPDYAGYMVKCIGIF